MEEYLGVLTLYGKGSPGLTDRFRIGPNA